MYINSCPNIYGTRLHYYYYFFNIQVVEPITVELSVRQRFKPSISNYINHSPFNVPTFQSFVVLTITNSILQLFREFTFSKKCIKQEMQLPSEQSFNSFCATVPHVTLPTQAQRVKESYWCITVKTIITIQ